MNYRHKNIWKILYLRMNCRSKLWIVTCGEGHMIWVTTGTRKMKDASNRFDLSSQACGSVVKTPPANAGDVGWIPRLGRSPGEGNGNPLQYSCLENPMDRGAWWPTVHGVTKRQTWLTEWLTQYLEWIYMLQSKERKQKQSPGHPRVEDAELRVWGKQES